MNRAGKVEGAVEGAKYCASTNRRYYLHRRVRRFARLNTRLRTVYVLCDQELNDKQRFYFDELRGRFGYAVQTEIPMS